MSTMKYPQTLADMLDNNAWKYPDETAFVWEDRRVTHAQFHGRVSKLANALRRLGLKRQDRVGILSQNNLEFQEVYGACEISGFICATVNWRLAIPEMVYIINDGAPKVMIFEAAYAETVLAMKDQLKTVEHFICIGGGAFGDDYDAFVESGDSSGVPFRPLPDDIAFLIYTSGTTGRPKGVMLGQGGQVAAAEILGSDQRNSPADRLLIMMPLFHIGAKIIQLAQHWRAGTVHVQKGFDPQAIISCIERERITVTHMAPTMVQTLLESPAIERGADISSLRMIVYAAAPMPIPVLKKGLKMLGPVFQHQFGQTEGIGTTLLAHQHRPDGTDRDREILTSVGQVSPRVSVRIVDDNGEDLPVGEVGEILLTSPGVMKGYWNNTAATIETLRDGWVHTGDVGRLDAEGYLYLVDRKKDMIISGGENIYSREVEEAVITHDAVSEVAVIGVPDEKWGEAVKAVVVLRAGMSATAQDLIDHCRTLIASYKRPRHVEFVDEIVKLPSGKIDKVRLRKLYGQA
jgi:acyl-CoA synthetase (AMP-forming)/AMP-acid ligase II